MDNMLCNNKYAQSRAPYGARGLKLTKLAYKYKKRKSRPVWGAWIEIVLSLLSRPRLYVAPRMGRVD